MLPGHLLHGVLEWPVGLGAPRRLADVLGHAHFRRTDVLCHRAYDEIAVRHDAPDDAALGDGQHPDVGVAHFLRGLEECRPGFHGDDVPDHDVPDLTIGVALAIYHGVLLPSSVDPLRAASAIPPTLFGPIVMRLLRDVGSAARCR